MSAGIWLVGNTRSNGKPFQVSGIDYLYLEDGFLYFKGVIDNLGSKTYEIKVRIRLYDQDDRLISDVSSYAFIYDESLKFKRITAPTVSFDNIFKQWLTSQHDNGDWVDDKKIPRLIMDYEIPEESSAYFTFASNNDIAFDNGSQRPGKIYDAYYMRNTNSEVYYIYITIEDYYDVQVKK